MSRFRVAMATLTILISPFYSWAEICTPAERTLVVQAPCNSVGQEPWLRRCSTFNSKLKNELDAAFDLRMVQLYEGLDVDFSPPATVAGVCNIAGGEFNTPVQLNRSCGEGWEIRSDTFNSVELRAPASPQRELAYRWGAWIQSAEYFKSMLSTELETGKIGVSAACKAPAELYLSKLDLLKQQELDLAHQPNRSSIADDQNPCQKDGEGDPDPLIVKNRMSGCYLTSSRERIEKAFLQLYMCEIRARATEVDQEFFAPGSACPGARQNPSRSLFHQSVEKTYLIQTCERLAYDECTRPSSSECRVKDPEDPQYPRPIALDEGTCWSCLSNKILSCARNPTRYNAFLTTLLSPSFPGDLLTQIPATGPYKGLGVRYSIASDGCSGKTQKGCPNSSIDTISAAVEFALFDLEGPNQSDIPSESPLNHAAELNAPVSENPQDWVQALPFEINF